ncbi:MAG: gfo/Idh/MocA family oxidoreductase [Spirochaetaceae bacterium]|nr:MAG: gfo/Idh/MocA family oxidoreductase [Spirochaetaceae bacterium]
MELNPVIEMLGRKLRLAIIGGGPGSFIGGVHRMAARMDNRYDLVTGVFSSDPLRSRRAAQAYGVEPQRACSDVTEMLDAESGRPDGADVVAIMTPNDTHHTYATAALDHGLDVICDKPLANTLEEARQLYNRVRQSGLVFCLTHNYTGYPMVRQARAMVEAGDLGHIRMLQVEYVQGGKARPLQREPGAALPWRFDPSRGGPSVVMGDIGSHAHNLLRYITGLEVAQVAAEMGHIVPDRDIDDYAGALLRLSNGARGSFWVTQAAAGVENCLKIRVCGSAGTLEWWQEFPQRLTFRPLDGRVQTCTPNGPGSLPLSRRACRIVSGHPEGFPEAFANLYSDAAEAIAARRSAAQPDPLALTFPTALDGLKGVEFVEAARQSSQSNGAWVALS